MLSSASCIPYRVVRKQTCLKGYQHDPWVQLPAVLNNWRGDDLCTCLEIYISERQSWLTLFIIVSKLHMNLKLEHMDSCIHACYTYRYWTTGAYHWQWFKMVVHKQHKCHWSFVVVIAKPARAVALLLGDHDSSHASTDPPDLVNPSLSWSARTTFPLVVGWSTKRQVDVAVVCAGTSCCSLATWLKRVLRRLLITSEIDSKPVVTATSSFRMNCCQLICSSCLWHFMWKASRALMSMARGVQVSAAYGRTEACLY